MHAIRSDNVLIWHSITTDLKLSIVHFIIVYRNLYQRFLIISLNLYLLVFLLLLNSISVSTLKRYIDSVY